MLGRVRQHVLLPVTLAPVSRDNNIRAKSTRCLSSSPSYAKKFARREKLSAPPLKHLFRPTPPTRRSGEHAPHTNRFDHVQRQTHDDRFEHIPRAPRYDSFERAPRTDGYERAQRPQVAHREPSPRYEQHTDRYEHTQRVPRESQAPKPQQAQEPAPPTTNVGRLSALLQSIPSGRLKDTRSARSDNMRTSNRVEAPQQEQQPTPSTKAETRPVSKYYNRRSTRALFEKPGLNPRARVNLVEDAVRLACDPTHSKLMKQSMNNDLALLQNILQQFIRHDAVVPLAQHKLGVSVLITLLWRGTNAHRCQLNVATANRNSALAKTEHGCSYVQNALLACEKGERALIVAELLATSNTVQGLASNQYGSHVIKDLLVKGSSEEKILVLELLTGYLAELAAHKDGRIVSTTILRMESPSSHERNKIIAECLKSGDTVTQLACSKTGSLVLQEMVELGHVEHQVMEKFSRAIKGRILSIALTEYGGLFIQRLARQFDIAFGQKLTDELMQSHDDMIQCLLDKNGRFVIDALLTTGDSQAERRRLLIDAMKGRLIEVINHTNGSVFVRSALDSFPQNDRELLLSELLVSPQALLDCAVHSEGHFVVEHILETGDEIERNKVADVLLRGERLKELCTGAYGECVVYNALMNLPLAGREELKRELRNISAEDRNTLGKKSDIGKQIVELLDAPSA